MNRPLIILAVLMVLISACKEKETVDFGYAYFPMEEGHFLEYDVLEVFHDVDLNPQHDSIRYRLKTKIGEEFVDNSGRRARKFFQSKYDLNSGNLDRKSTRLNSSHVRISYAVFCLKKKK